MFCNNCGASTENSARFCNNCGEILAAAQPQEPGQPQQPYQPQQPPPPPYGVPPTVPPPAHHYGGPVPGTPYPYPAPAGVHVNIGPGSYAERLHSFGRSGAFLLGVILFAAGSLFNIFMSFSAFSLLSIGLLALPAIGLIMICSASSQPRLPEKSLTGLTLLKVTAIIQLVFMCLGAAGVAIGFIAVGILGAMLEPAVIIVVLFMGLLALGIFALYIYFYYVSVLRIISGIRNGLVNNVFMPLRGVQPLMIIVIIAAAFGVIGSMVMIGASGGLNRFINEISWTLGLSWSQRQMLQSFLGVRGGGAQFFRFLFTTAAHVGTVLCVAVLHSFNNSLKTAGYVDSSAAPHPPHQPPQPPVQW